MDQVDDPGTGLFSDHVMQESPARSFSFFRQVAKTGYSPISLKERARFSASGAYSFTLTWTPGHLSLTGDIGDLVLTQLHSAARFEEALEWAATADYAYLMGKSDKKTGYDAEATLAYLVEAANQPVIHALNGDATTDRSSGKRKRSGGYRQQLAAPMSADREEREAEFETLRHDSPYYWVPRREETPYRPGCLRPENLFDIPDCWTGWLDIWNYLEGGIDRVTISHDYVNGAKSVMTHAGRARLKSDLAELCRDQTQLVEFLRETSWDDYYGSESYPEFTRLQVDAVRYGCRKILDKLATESKAAA